ncbi:hypothetical protein KHQ81_15670 (plasmid) [Mycoplasmatota bacterium]|nr:hypothetical protein KHQ81_15670 [Mycoplasmatota bacterium]
MNSIKSKVKKLLLEKEILINKIEIRRFDKENGTIDKITLSIDDISSGDNILYQVKDVLDHIEEEYGLSIHKRLLEF